MKKIKSNSSVFYIFDNDNSDNTFMVIDVSTLLKVSYSSGTLLLAFNNGTPDLKVSMISFYTIKFPNEEAFRIRSTIHEVLEKIFTLIQECHA